MQRPNRAERNQRARILRFWVLLWLGIAVWGQGWTQVEVSHQSDWFYIEPGTDIHIQGSLISLAGNADPLSNLGEMYISDSVTCFGDNRIFGSTPDTVTAEVILNGAALQTFTGTTTMRFGKLTLRNAYDSLRLENTVELYSRLWVDAGNVDVASDTLDLLQTGYIVGENADDRIFTGLYGRIHLNRPLLLGNAYPDIAGIGLGLQVSGNLGSNVSIYRGNFSQANVSNGSIERFYFFDPQLNGDVFHPTSRYWDSTELAGNDESRLQLFESSTSGVNWVLVGGTADTLADEVDGGAALAFTMTTNSALTLAEGTCDSLPLIQFDVDTIPICGVGNNAWLVPQGITGMTSVWSDGTLNEDSIQVTAAGTYEVEVTDLKGCQNLDSVVVVVAPVPQADFQVIPVCIGDSSLFLNQSTLAGGTLSYAWELNDVYTSGPDTTSRIDPGLVYTNPGTYAVTLTATSALGCADTHVGNAIVLPYPVADFSVADHCGDSLLAFVNNSSVTPAAGLLYQWDFGNGDSSSAATPNYSYAAPGTQAVTLTTTSNGCATSITKPVTIFPNPEASFLAPAVCEGFSHQFTNTTTLSSGNLGYVWEFAPTQTSVLSDPQFNFGAAGSYPVTLTATSGDGCSDDTTISVTVNALPQPTFTANPTCMGQAMSFQNTSSGSSSFQWNFNGEGQSSLYSPQFTFTSEGTKSIVLTETDLNGCIDSTIQAVISKPSPTAAFSVTGNCENAPISFLNTSSTPSGSMNYQWDFGDQTTSTQISPDHVYAMDGTFSVVLVAENNGCFDTLNFPLTVDSIPLLNLGGTIATCDSQYVFDAHNTGSTYLWSNGSSGQQLTAIFSGDYWVSVTNAAGCSAADSVSLTLNTVVTPQLGPDADYCDVAPLDAGYPGATYAWSTGETTQTIQPTSSGAYSVVVTDQNGCIGSDTIQATVFATVQPDLGPDLSLCEGAVQTLGTGQSLVAYDWNTGDSVAAIQVTQSALYSVLTLDSNGCPGADSIEVIFHPNPVVDLGADSTYCDSIRYDLTQPDMTYQWSTGNTSPVQVVQTSGDFSVLLANSVTGCQSEDSIAVAIAVTPSVDLGNDSILCSGADLLLDAGNPGNSYAWNVGDTSQSLVAASSGLYAVAVTTPEGCVGIDSVDLVVSAPIQTDLGSDFTLCQGQEVTISSPILGGQYAWYQDGMLLSNTSRNLSVTAFGAYVVEVLDSVGCFATDTVVALQTGSEIHAEFLVSTIDLFAGDTLQFVNLSYPDTFTSYWSFGDGAFSIAEDPTHVYLVPGTYAAILEVSNGICTDTLQKDLTVVPKVIVEPGESPEPVLNDFVSTVLYPNPNNGTFRVDVELLEEGLLKVQCVDMYGHVLLEQEEWGQDFELDFKELNISAGLYLLRLRVSGRSETLKFIKE